MRLGIFSKTFGGSDPSTVLSAVSGAGFAAAQYNMACSGLAAMPDAIDLSISRAIAAAAAASRVEISAISGTYNMIHPDARVRDEGHARLQVLAAACKDIGTGLITLCTGTRDPDDQWRAHPDNHSPEAWRDLLQSMSVAVETAESHDIWLGIEPELANVVNSARKAKQLIDQVGSKRLRIVFDPANLFEVATVQEQRRTVSEAAALLGDRIAIAHAKDRHSDGTFATAGRGVLDYGHYVACLSSVGFDGALIAHGLAAHEARPVADFLARVVDQFSVKVDS